MYQWEPIIEWSHTSAHWHKQYKLYVNIFVLLVCHTHDRPYVAISPLVWHTQDKQYVAIRSLVWSTHMIEHM